MTSASQEEPYDVLDGFFAEFDRAAAGDVAPRRRPLTQGLGYAGALLVGIGLIIVVLGALAWFGAFVFNQLLAQVG